MVAGCRRDLIDAVARQVGGLAVMTDVAEYIKVDAGRM
jgi:hypothetical protein